MKTRDKISIIIEYNDYSEYQLKYLLISIDKYTKFEHSIYIMIEDQQVYDWLYDERVDIIKYIDICPEQYKVYKNISKEFFIPFISGLDDKIIYLSDGVFFSDVVIIDDFFYGNKCNIYSYTKKYNHINEMSMYCNTKFLYKLINVRQHKYQYQSLFRGCLPLLKTACMDFLSKNIEKMNEYVFSKNLDIYLYGLYIERFGYSNYRELSINNMGYEKIDIKVQ